MNRPRWTRRVLATLIAAVSTTMVAAPASAQRPLDAWSVSLTVSQNYPWPTTMVTFTATANQDLVQPYNIFIVNTNTGEYLAACATGRVCTASAKHPQPDQMTYRAYIARSPQVATVPPPDVQASGDQYVHWRGTHVELTAWPATAYVGEPITLTATVNRDDWPETMDIGPSPWWIQIYDMATGTRLARCGTGSTCTASVPVRKTEPGTWRYVAHLANDTTAYPVPQSSIQGESSWAHATWTTTQWRVWLDVSRQVFDKSVTGTAQTGAEVDMDSLYLEIFDNNTGDLVTACDIGSTCGGTWAMADRPWLGRWHSYVAFVTWSYTTRIPDAPIASSIVASAVHTEPVHPVP